MVNEASGSAEGGLKLEPHMIPKLQAAFESALDQLTSLAQDGNDGFKIPVPAMADEASKEFQAEFNKVADDAGQQLNAYRQRLREVVDKLGAIQKAYDQHEHDTAAELSSQLGP